MDKKIILVDLDGTFVSVNTFHKWMQFLFIEELKKLHFSSLFKLLNIIYLRLFKFITHSQMKFKVLQISEQQITQKQINEFVEKLNIYINPTIIQEIKDSSNICILATAAPAFYARRIKEKYHFHYLIATPDTHTSSWKETIKEEKQKVYLKLLNDQTLNATQTILYTDHYDDLPLMELSDILYLVQPNEETLRRVKNEHIYFKQL